MGTSTLRSNSTSTLVEHFSEEGTKEPALELREVVREGLYHLLEVLAYTSVIVAIGMAFLISISYIPYTTNNQGTNPNDYWNGVLYMIFIETPAVVFLIRGWIFILFRLEDL